MKMPATGAGGKVARMIVERIECANCGERIGNLETPQLYREQVVCAKCWEKLSSQDIPPDLMAGVPLSYESPSGDRSRMRGRQTRAESTPTGSVITIEQTAKRWKAQILLSSAVCIFGAIMAILGLKLELQTDILTGIGAVVFFVGLFWSIGVRMAAWWHHG